MNVSVYVVCRCFIICEFTSSINGSSRRGFREINKEIRLIYFKTDLYFLLIQLLPEVCSTFQQPDLRKPCSALGVLLV